MQLMVSIPAAIDNLEAVIAAFDRALGRPLPGYFLVMSDGGMVVEKNTLKLGGSCGFRLTPSDPTLGFAFSTLDHAGEAALVWNSILTQEQRDAGCSVEIRTHHEYMEKARGHYARLLTVMKLCI